MERADVKITVYLLQAAFRAGCVLDSPHTDQRAAYDSYRTVVSGGFFAYEALRHGQSILERARLLINDSGALHVTDDLMRIRDMPESTAVEMIFHSLVVAEKPLWVFGALSGPDLQWENVPDEERELLTTMYPSAEEREALLLTLARTFDAERLRELGETAELAVMDACRAHLLGRGREDLARLVTRVSLVSDQLGYDLTANDTAGDRHRLEVKKVRVALDHFEFFLSRNEADFAKRDRQWALVAVAIDGESTDLLGWCRSGAFENMLPVDTASGGQWASARVSVPLSELMPGLPLDAGTHAN